MAKRILYIKPSAYDTLNADIRAYLQRYGDPGTEVEVWSMPRGPQHLEYEFYQALAAQEILKAVLRAERAGFDGAVIGCFDDPSLDAAREICRDMVVAGPAESAMSLAAALGGKFSIIVGRDKWVPRMQENVVKYGHSAHLASFRPLGMGVPEFHCDPALTARRMREEIRRAIDEDKAEVIILGCTMEFGFFEQMQREFGVPVLDVMLTGFKHAEYLVGLKQKAGWYASQTGKYAGPEKAEIEKWHIPADYDLEGLF